MTTETMSPLRRRMVEDMRIRGLGASQQRSHIRSVKEFAEYLGRSPDGRVWELVEILERRSPSMAISA